MCVNIKGKTELLVIVIDEDITYRTRFKFFPRNWDASIYPWHINVCRTRVLLAAKAEYRVSSDLPDDDMVQEEQGSQYNKKMKTVDATIPPLRGIFPYRLEITGAKNLL